MILLDSVVHTKLFFIIIDELVKSPNELLEKIGNDFRQKFRLKVRQFFHVIIKRYIAIYVNMMRLQVGGLGKIKNSCFLIKRSKLDFPDLREIALF